MFTVYFKQKEIGSNSYEAIDCMSVAFIINTFE